MRANIKLKCGKCSLFDVLGHNEKFYVVLDKDGGARGVVHIHYCQEQIAGLQNFAIHIKQCAVEHDVAALVRELLNEFGVAILVFHLKIMRAVHLHGGGDMDGVEEVVGVLEDVLQLVVDGEGLVVAKAVVGGEVACLSENVDNA